MSLQRFGIVIGLRAEAASAYRALHADAHPGVRDLLSRYHIRNFSIFVQEIAGALYEFGYYEYEGDDYAGDMARLAKEPRQIAWLEQCDPMQLPLPNEKGWTRMEQVYYNS
jgi:L-rhamnose mutarotase